MTRPGSTKMIDDSVPAAEATVWTMLFSWIVTPLKPRSTAIEMTAAGIEVENVSPALRPKKTLAAVKTSVITTPRITPRTVSSFSASGGFVAIGFGLFTDVVMIRVSPQQRATGTRSAVGDACIAPTGRPALRRVLRLDGGRQELRLGQAIVQTAGHETAVRGNQ